MRVFQRAGCRQDAEGKQRKTAECAYNYGGARARTKSPQVRNSGVVLSKGIVMVPGIFVRLVIPQTAFVPGEKGKEVGTRNILEKKNV